MKSQSYVALALAAALALALGACSSSSSDDPPPGDDMTMVDPEPEPEPTDLETTQAAAKTASDAAIEASDDAGEAADGAEAATMNAATMQTGAKAEMYAMDARKYAGMAKNEADKAKAASDAAAAATLASVAGGHSQDAQAAQEAAEGHAKMAGDKATMATDAAKMELMIDGTMKSVGETTIDAMAGASSVTTGAGKDAQTVVTGLIKDLNPMAEGMAITGMAYVPEVKDDLSTEEIETATPAKPYKQTAAARMFAIGKTLDSSDDMARLMLVTDYAGTNMVKVFAPADNSTQVSGTKAGYISIDVTDTSGVTETNNVALRSEGMFYPAGDPAATAELVHGDSVAADAKPVEVFSYTDPNDDTMKYATLASTTTTGTTTTSTYNSGADVTADNAAPDGPDAGTELDDAKVTVGIPGAVAYEHLHFGVWASLGEAAMDGSQKIDDLGIGFVQSIGDGMTGADMQNAGTADYKGNWVAAVRSGGGGSLSLNHGAAELMANFDKAMITADLMGLAKLEGSIDGSTFSGTKATVASTNTHGLTGGGKFTGSFDGGFYGSQGAEAGGIFDFTSANMSAGEFRGAFGGKKQEN